MTNIVAIDPQAELSATRAECQMLLTQIEEAALLRIRARLVAAVCATR